LQPRPASCQAAGRCPDAGPGAGPGLGARQRRRPPARGDRRDRSRRGEAGDGAPAVRAVHFFFQAQDGIRDATVTGVQTCALPISEWIADIDVEKAAEEVNLADFIRTLPGGFGEEVRERGSTLSTGQKQLISFARAL